MFAVEIAKPIASRVFMEIAWADDVSDRQAVVFVETDRFVAAWRREPYGFNKEAAHGTLDRTRLEKYKAVESDFARSQQTPVPLAHVICRKKEERKLDLAQTSTCGRRHVELPTQPYYVDFDDGVTRTFWLIANGARVFPIQIDANEASALHNEAGSPDVPPMTVNELFEAAQNLSFDSNRHR